MGAALTNIVSRDLIDPKFSDAAKIELKKQKRQPELDEKYNSLPVKKRLLGGIRSTKVELLDGNIVRKEYDMLQKGPNRLFWHEVGIMDKLKDCPYVPTLLHWDRRRGAIYSTYCGKNVQNSPEIQQRIHKQHKELRKKWGVYRKDASFVPRMGNAKSYGLINNVTIKGDRLYFIDMGGVSWCYQAPSKTDDGEKKTNKARTSK